MPPATEMLDDAFLESLRLRTEEAWSAYEARDLLRAGTTGCDWQRGTRWTSPLSAAQIADAEHRWGLTFPPDYARFLAALHTTDLPLICTWVDEHGNLALGERATFTNWLGDAAVVRTAVEWPLESLLAEVEQERVWMRSWGRRPRATSARRARVTDLYQDAPTLIPIVGNRYLVAADGTTEGNPIVSVWESDIIAWAPDLASFLRLEFADLIGIEPRPGAATPAVDEQERSAAEDRPDEDAAADALDARVAAVPFWGELTGRIVRKAS